MSVPEFVFALQLSDNAQHDQMIAEVAKAVCAYAGLNPAAAGELTASLRSAIGGGRGSCSVRFAGRDGQFEIIVAHDGGEEWRTSRTLP